MKAIRYFAETSIRALPECADVMQRFPDLEWIEDYQSFRGMNMQTEKRCVILARKRGAWLKPFHCYDSASGFRYLSLDLAEGCAFDCVYCYLQSYLNHGALVVFLDFERLHEEMQQLHGSNMWVSTGLLTDSLLAEKQWPYVSEISRSIPPGNIVELRTKSEDVSSLADPKIIRDRVVISWSLNPESIVRHFEYQTASLEERLRAASTAIHLGFRVGFHLDPVFYFEEWEAEYSGLIQRLEIFPIDRIAFLSLGLFRYMPQLGSLIRKRFPSHTILSGEFFPDADGKYHYLRAIRKNMYAAFSQWLQPWSATVPIFRSMEPDERLGL